MQTHVAPFLQPDLLAYDVFDIEEDLWTRMYVDKDTGVYFSVDLAAGQHCCSVLAGNEIVVADANSLMFFDAVSGLQVSKIRVGESKKRITSVLSSNGHLVVLKLKGEIEREEVFVASRLNHKITRVGDFRQLHSVCISPSQVQVSLLLGVSEVRSFTCGPSNCWHESWRFRRDGTYWLVAFAHSPMDDFMAIGCTDESLRIVDTQSGMLVNHLGCLHEVSRTVDTHIPRLGGMTYSHGGEYIAAWGTDYEGEAWLQIVGLNSKTINRDGRYHNQFAPGKILNQRWVKDGFLYLRHTAACEHICTAASFLEQTGLELLALCYREEADYDDRGMIQYSDRATAFSFNIESGQAMWRIEFMEWHRPMRMSASSMFVNRKLRPKSQWRHAPIEDGKGASAMVVGAGNRPATELAIHDGGDLLGLCLSTISNQNGEFAQVTDELILHLDPPTRIPPQEAEKLAWLQEAGFLERLLDTRWATTSQVDNDTLEDRTTSQVIVVQFNRCPKELPIALAKGRALRQCRQMLEAAGHNWRLPNGDMIFVHPDCYRPTIHAWMSSETAPCFTILFTQDLDYLVQESIADLGKGAKAKRRNLMQVNLHATNILAICDAASEEGENAYWPYVVSRTFLNTAPLANCGVADRASVTQSSTEVHQGGLNPRRIQGVIDFE